MATPTLRALREHFGAEARLVGVMKPYVSKVLAGTSWLDETIYDRRKSSYDWRAQLTLVEQLRGQQLDTIILLTNSFRSALIARLSGARRRVGYARYGRGFLLTNRVAPPREDGQFVPLSAIDYYLNLAATVGCDADSLSPRMELATLPEDEAGADLVWKNLGLDRAERVVVFNTGGAYGAAKHWPNEYYVALAQEIVGDSDNAVLIVCGPQERENALYIEQAVGHPRVRSMADQDLSLGVAKACIGRSDLLISTDSGPRHFAPALDVPVIALFGPIDWRWSDSHHPRAINLYHDVPCRPCGKRVCPLAHHKCMQELTVEEVYQAVLRQFELSERACAGKPAA